jgi:hypothetical protein
VRATIPQTTSQKAGVTTVSVGQLAIGPVQIGRLSVTDFHVGLSTGTAALRNFRVTLTLHLSLDWWVGVKIPFDGSPHWSGTIDLGSPSVTIPLGNCTVPGLQNLSIDVDHLAAGPVVATATPLTNLTLGTAVAEQIRAQNITVPAQGFAIAGLALTGARANDINIPAVAIGEVDIARVQGEALPMGTLSLANIGLPSAAVNDIASQGITADATGAVHELHADAGVLRITLRITPQARGEIEQLTLTGLTASASIAAIELQNVVAPYELLNLKLSDLGLEQITIPALGVS